jgi:cytochrome b561
MQFASMASNCIATFFAKGFVMEIIPATTRYGSVARGLHWIVAALVVVQFLLAPIPEDLPRDIHVDAPFGLDKLGLLAQHKSFGMTVLMLMVVRVLWRWRNKPPAFPETMKPAARFLARATHIAFYVILIAMPLSGWMMTSAKGASSSWFGLWNWPSPISQNDHAFEPLRMMHGILSRLLFVLALIHVAAALKHHFWNKDGVLMRMLPFGRSAK